MVLLYWLVSMTKGRPRQFDTTEALDQALLVFWRKGYRGTSLDDLTDAMQINRPSLYAAFGDKEALFLKAVDQYRDKYIVPKVRKLLGCESLREGLNEFFRSIASVVVENETPPGCFIACLLSEECCDSEEIRTKLADAIASADAAFTRLFEAHRKELKKSLEPGEAGHLMTSIIHGISIRARSGATKRTLLEIGECFMTTILRSDA